VLLTDIVGSTRHAVTLGDAAWRDILERHNRMVERQVVSAGGRVVKNTGDGHLISFHNSRAAVDCARALFAIARSLGFEIRAGMHTGDVQVIGDDLAGLTVHIAARVCALAAPGSMVGTAAVALRARAAGAVLEDHGLHELRDLPGQFRLFQARAPRPEPAAATA